MCCRREWDEVRECWAVTGKQGDLRASAAYPRTFGRAVDRTFVSNLCRCELGTVSCYTKGRAFVNNRYRNVWHRDIPDSIELPAYFEQYLIDSVGEEHWHDAQFEKVLAWARGL